LETTVNRAKASHRLTALGVALAVPLCAVLFSGCSSSAAAGPDDTVLIDSGTIGGVGWDLWAWEDKGELCMGLGTQAAPYTAQNPASGGSMSGSQCGFSGKGDSMYYASGQNAGNGPPTLAVLFGPVPTAAAEVRVTSKITVKTTAFPSGAGLPSARYWVWPGPYQLPASDGTALAEPKPLDAAGKPVALQAY
jgi:hypothetical protein